MIVDTLKDLNVYKQTILGTEENVQAAASACCESGSGQAGAMRKQRTVNYDLNLWAGELQCLGVFG